MNCDPASLANAARCWNGCVTGTMLSAARTYLLCGWANAVSGGSLPTVTGFRILGASGTATASWDIPPTGVTDTQVWVSHDNVTYVLQDTVPSPGTNSAFFPADGRVLYAKARWITATAQGAFSTVQTDWTSRVLNNGGAQPSTTSRDATIGLIAGLRTDLIVDEFALIYTYCPDSLIAAFTPPIDLVGAGMAINHNFVLADLTVNGLIGDGATKYLDSKISPLQLGGLYSATNCGGSAYLFTDVSQDGLSFGVKDGALNNLTGLQGPAVVGDTTYWFCSYQGALGQAAGSLPAPQNGLWVATRTANNVQDTYNANSTFGFRHCVNNPGGPVAMSLVNQNFYLFCENDNGVTTNFNTRRISMHAFHSGLANAATAQAWALRAQAFLVAKGGGFV